MLPDAESTSAVTFEVIRLERIHRGRVVAIADVGISIEGVDLLTCGWTIEARPAGYLVAAPRHQRPGSALWRESVKLPTELATAIAAELLAMMGLDCEVRAVEVT